MMDGFSREMQTDVVEDTVPTKRDRTRDSLFLTASLLLEGEVQARDVRVRNLSAGGLMSELGRPVTVGTKATLVLRGIGEVSGKVAWYTEGRAGIAFDHPIDPQRARKPVGGGKQTPVYAKASFSARDPSRG